MGISKWNGLDLQNEFAAALGDTSTEGKALALDHINEAMLDICSKANWPTLRTLGRKKLVIGDSHQDLLIPSPTSPVLTLSSGGALTADAIYKVLCTYVLCSPVRREDNVFSEFFDSSSGFTYDTDEIEFSSGVARQLSLNTSNELCCATFTEDQNFVRSAGTEIGTLSGATVTGGYLDCTGGTLKHCTYEDSSNFPSGQTGTIIFGIKPNFSSNPSTTQQIIYSALSGTDAKNQISLIHKTNGKINLQCTNSVGAVVIAVDIGTWQPTSGVDYVIALTFDFTTGATKLFIDGVQLGTTITTTFTAGTRGVFRIASDYASTASSRSFFNFIRMFSDVKTGAVLSAIPPEYTYAESALTLPSFNYGNVGAIQSYTSLEVSLSESTAKFIINGKYHDGTSWVTSDNSHSQANTASEINLYFSTLEVSSPTSVIVVFPASQDTLESISSLVLEYIGQDCPIGEPEVETIAGDYSDAITPTGSDLTIIATMPTSSEPEVIKRKVYLSKDSGSWLLYATINNNSDTTISITADTTSVFESPDLDYIKEIDGDPYFSDAAGRSLINAEKHDIILSQAGNIPSGTPCYYDLVNNDKLILSPKPSATLVLNFYYFRNPPKIFADVTSIPILPPRFKKILRAAVIAIGYEYDDADGQESKRNNYEQIVSREKNTLIRNKTGSQKRRDTRPGWYRYI
jgi:hypothetical protein